MEGNPNPKPSPNPNPSSNPNPNPNQALYKICIALARAMPQMSNMVILLFLIMMIFSLLGALPSYHP